MEAKIRSIDEEIKERIEKALLRIENINFFQPIRTVDEANSLVSTVDEIIKDHMNELKRWKRYEMRWISAYCRAVDTARRFAEDKGRARLWKKACEKGEINAFHWAKEGTYKVLGSDGYKEAFFIPWIAREFLADYVAWEVVRDSPEFKNNPAEHYVMLYEMGLFPKGFAKVNGVERFIVDFPLVINREKILGCYANRDGKILFGHKWEENCKNLRYLKFPRREIEWVY